MKWIKKWSFLILLFGVGLIYLAAVDRWQTYAETYGRVKQFCRRFIGEEEEFFGNSGEDSGGKGAWEEAPDGAEDEAPDGSGDKAPDGSEDKAPDGSGEEGNGAKQSEVLEEPGQDAENAGAAGQPGGEGHVTEDGFWDGSDPVYMTVEDDYFSDAVFIGDSRTVGMLDYGGLEDIAAFYASKGMTVYKLFDAQIVDVPGQIQKQTVEEALLGNSFRKIYLMVGINEMGMGTVETFIEKYKEVVDRLLELQPDAILYIQAILKVTTERSEKGDYINNEGIIARNEELAKLADNKRIFFLDANPSICDETGGMEPTYTFDGVHLKAQYIEIWKNYLKEHAIKLGDA